MKQIDFNTLLPDWNLEIKVIPNINYHFCGISPSGTKSEVTESDYNKGYFKCLEGAYNIELRENNDNKFLYDIFLKLLDSNFINEKRYDHMAFGSWLIESENSRVILDGRDYELRLEYKNKKDWDIIESFTTRDNIKLKDIETIFNKFN